jgi:biopolymer transport protein ExbD
MATQDSGSAGSEPGDPMLAPSAPRPPRPKRRRLHKPHPSGLSGSAVKNEINVTPLVDVVLVLLIIFMVVTPMLSRGAKVDLPETQHHTKKNDTGEQVVVSVTYEGKVYVDADPVPDDQIVSAVQNALRKKASEVHVKADKRLTYVEVRRVLEKIHEAGAPSVALGTEEHKAEGAH